MDNTAVERKTCMQPQQRDNSYLGTAPVGQLLFKLAVPTISAQIINMLYNIVDRVYIGRMKDVGDLALTGVGVCMPIILIVSAFAALVSGGGAPRASIFMGKGDYKSAEDTMGSCFSLQIIVSVLLMVILLLGGRTFLLSFGASENTIEYAASYLQIYALGTLFVQLTLGMNNYITAQGFTGIGMLTVLIGAICNIILDPIFIFAFGMGVRGAALATILSQGISCTWVVLFLRGKTTLLKLTRDSIRIRPKLALPCIALGMAPFIMQSSESVISVCFNSSLLRYGGDIAVGSMTILTSVMQFALLPLQGLSQGAQPIASYNFGARNADRVRKTFRLLLTVSFLYSATLWVFLMAVPQVFAGIFTPKPEFLSYAARALRIYCGAEFMFGVQISCQMTFIALGKSISSITVAVVRKFILLLPLIYIMPLLSPVIIPDKATAVYCAEPVADLLAVIFTIILFAIQFRKAMQSIETPLSGKQDGAVQGI